jgi:hypothetical protein
MIGKEYDRDADFDGMRALLIDPRKPAGDQIAVPDIRIFWAVRRF